MSDGERRTDRSSEPLHVWDVAEAVDRKRRVRSGEFDVIPGMRGFRKALLVLVLVGVASFVVVLVALVFG